MTFSYDSEAKSELYKSINYYENKSDGLGIDFLIEVEYSINLLLKYPESGNPIDNRVRKRLINRFPFEIIYVVEFNEIRILAIKHNKQRPGYWMERKP